MEAAFSLGVYSRHATGREGRLRPPPRPCPPGHNSGGEGSTARAARTAGRRGRSPAGSLGGGGYGASPRASYPPRAAAAPPLRPLLRRLRAPRAAAGLGWAFALFGCLKRSGEQGKCRLTAGKMRGLAYFVCKK